MNKCLYKMAMYTGKKYNENIFINCRWVAKSDVYWFKVF